MVLADTMAIFLTIVGLLICFNAVWLLCRALWGPLVAHCRDVHRDGMVKSFFLGLPLTALIVVLFGALTSNKQGPWGLIGILVMAAYLMFTSIGVAGIAELVGEKLGGKTQDQPPWRETVRGGAVLVLSFLFPFLGWLLIMPVALVVGCGATMRGMYREWKCSRHGKKSQTASSKSSGVQGASASPEILVGERLDVASDAVDLNQDA